MGKIKYKEGDQIGPEHLLMIKRVPIDERKNRRKPEGVFICPKCQKEFIATIGNVVSGNATACSNHRAEVMANTMSKDISNQSFGKLTPLYWTGKYRGTIRIWMCQCECGNLTEVDVNALLTGNTSSCGCLRESKGELKIKQLLESLNIKYYKEKTFNKCINPKTKGILRFDFYLPNYNCCIEYDGIQHFKSLGKNGNWGNKKSLEEREKLDQIKNQYCKNNNIYLIRIPYIDYKILNEEYLLERLNNLDKYNYNNQNSS